MVSWSSQCDRGQTSAMGGARVGMGAWLRVPVMHPHIRRAQ